MFLQINKSVLTRIDIEWKVKRGSAVDDILCNTWTPEAIWANTGHLDGQIKIQNKQQKVLRNRASV